MGAIEERGKESIFLFTPLFYDNSVVIKTLICLYSNMDNKRTKKWNSHVCTSLECRKSDTVRLLVHYAEPYKCVV